MLNLYSFVTLKVVSCVEEVLDMYRLGATAIARPTRIPMTRTSKPTLSTLKFPTVISHRAGVSQMPLHDIIFVQSISLIMPAEKARYMKNERTHRAPPTTTPPIDDNPFIQAPLHINDNTRHSYIDLVTAFAEFEDLKRAQDGDMNIELELGGNASRKWVMRRRGRTR